MHKSAMFLLEELKTWNWEESESPYLMLGFIISMFFGGALEWRPMMYVIGGGGTGKSSLQKFTAAVLNNWSIYTDSATEAALRQNLNFKSVPIQYDEAEGTDFTNSNHINEVIGFMRLSAGGSITHKGTADQRGTQYIMQSSMLMTSIFQPGLTAADASRLIQLKLNTLESSEKKNFQTDKYAKEGMNIISYFCHNWTQFKEWNEKTWNWLAQNAGFTEARECDVYAPVLALAAVMTEAEELTNDVLEGLFPELKRRVDREKEQNEGRACLNYLLQQEIHDGYSPYTISSLVAKINSDMMTDDTSDNDLLARHGMRVDKKNNYFFVASNHPQLYTLFNDTRWRATIKGSAGAWRDALARLDGTKEARKRLDEFISLRGVTIPLPNLYTSNTAQKE